MPRTPGVGETFGTAVRRGNPAKQRAAEAPCPGVMPGRSAVPDLTAFDLAVALGAFVPLLLVELPDKTFIATLVLATRAGPLRAWIGVGLAFGVQCLVAVAAGGLLSRLPEAVVATAAAVLFAVGAAVLWRSARVEGADDSAGSDSGVDASSVQGSTGLGLRAIASSFAVVFVAEWGDLSQLFTAGIAARTGDPVSVFVGAWSALLTVSALAAVLGAALQQRLPIRAVRYAGAAVCAVLAVLSVAQAAGVPLPV